MPSEKKELAANEGARRKGGASRQVATRPQQRYCQTSRAAACLVHVLAHHGLAGTSAEIEKRLRASASDNDVINFLDVAEGFGLIGHPIVLTTAEWRKIPPASILHWGSDSLVVFMAHHARLIAIHDPVHGHRQVDLAEFRRQFTGVVLVLAPDSSAQG